jgi:hypothetical protein
LLLIARRSGAPLMVFGNEAALLDLAQAPLRLGLGV